jgi:hypothetical protein
LSSDLVLGLKTQEALFSRYLHSSEALLLSCNQQLFLFPASSPAAQLGISHSWRPDIHTPDNDIDIRGLAPNSESYLLHSEDAQASFSQRIPIIPVNC